MAHHLTLLVVFKGSENCIMGTSEYSRIDGLDLRSSADKKWTTALNVILDFMFTLPASHF